MFEARLVTLASLRGLGPFGFWPRSARGRAFQVVNEQKNRGQKPAISSQVEHLFYLCLECAGRPQLLFAGHPEVRALACGVQLL